MSSASRAANTSCGLLDSVAASTPRDQIPCLDVTAARLLDAAVPAVPDAGPDDPNLRLLAPTCSHWCDAPCTPPSSPTRWRWHNACPPLFTAQGTTCRPGRRPMARRMPQSSYSALSTVWY
jgi:hypothetical protein